MKHLILAAANAEREAGTVIVLDKLKQLVQVGFSSGYSFQVTGSEASVLLDEFGERAEFFDVSIEDAILHSAQVL